jgi:hypothetical protein
MIQSGDRSASRIRRNIWIALLTVCSACHSSATAPTTTTPDTSTAAVFVGTLDPGGTATQSFTAQAAASLKLTLASVAADANQPLASALELGVGTLSGSDCVVSTTQRAAPSLMAQVTGTVPAGAFCVVVSDPDAALPATITFALGVVTGSRTSQVTAPGASTWTTNLNTGGSVTRSIPTSAAGTLSVTLDSLSYANGQLGIGLGIPVTGGCAIARVSVGGASTTISAPVDSGEFCVKIFDAGRTTGIVNFAATISYP